MSRPPETVFLGMWNGWCLLAKTDEIPSVQAQLAGFYVDGCCNACFFNKCILSCLNSFLPTWYSLSLCSKGFRVYMPARYSTLKLAPTVAEKTQATKAGHKRRTTCAPTPTRPLPSLPHLSSLKGRS